MVRYVTVEDLEIFEQARKLEDATREAREKWVEEVKRSHQGKIEYKDTYPLFEEYIKLHNEWRKYFDDNAHILLAQVIK